MGDNYFGDMGDSSHGKWDGHQEYQSRQHTSGDFSHIYNTTQIVYNENNGNRVEVNYDDVSPSRISVKLMNNIAWVCTVAGFLLALWVFFTGRTTFETTASIWRKESGSDVSDVIDALIATASSVGDYLNGHLILVLGFGIFLIATVIAWRKYWLRKNKIPAIARRWRLVRWGVGWLRKLFPNAAFTQPFRSLIRDASSQGNFVRAVPYAVCPECLNDNIEDRALIFSKGFCRRRKVWYVCPFGHEGPFNARSLQVRKRS